MQKFNPKKRANFFDKILMKVPTTNTFDLSYDNKLTFNMGELVPVMCQEVIPGDSFKITAEHLLKMAPLATPVFQKCRVHMDYFFVPNRLLWENFEKFQAYDTLNEIPKHPYISVKDLNSGQVEVCSIADYLGIPTGDYSAYDTSHPMNTINALPLAAYYKIYDDYYRDQNLVDEKFKLLSDGDNSGNPMFGDYNPLKLSPLRRAWERDYFTSCLPFAQKGQEVVLPLGETAPINYVPNGNPDIITDVNGNQVTGNHGLDSIGGVFSVDDLPTPGSSLPANLDNSDHLEVDLTNATAASINDLRVAVRLQEFFERNARLGTRYIEQMLGKFGVRISDERAHRSELIGTTGAPVMFSEVLQTSQTDTTPLAQQGGHGTSINSQFASNYYCEEHGWIIGIMNVQPATGYMQGLHRKFTKNDILDYYDPMFSNLGEQAVLNAEVYADQNGALKTFGYQSRYAEHKYNLSEVHGTFRTTEADWHMDRIFTAPPQLNDVFINADPTHRVFADTSEETKKMWCYLHHHIIANRKIPFYSTPTFNSPLNG
jgi:hypothetical protein